MSSALALGREIVAVGRRLRERGLIAGPDGNVSVRLPDGRVLVTPAGMSKGDVAPNDLVELTPAGVRRRGFRHVSSEVRMHLRIYERRTDVRAAVHAHRPPATGFAVAGERFTACVLPKVIFQLGEVPLLHYPGCSTASGRTRRE